MSADSKRVRVRGAAWLGGRTVAIRADAPHDVDDPWGTLAEAAHIRDVVAPAGSKLAVDLDFADITLTLAEATVVRGVALPAGTALTLPGRGFGFPGLRIPAWALPALLVALPWLWWRSRREARVIDVRLGEDVVIGDARLAAGAQVRIHGDGRVEVPSR